MLKRSFDALCSAAGLVALSPLFLLVAIAIKLDSPGPVFFRQKRIGRRFLPFLIYKFRTMSSDAGRRGGPITIGDDPRITRVGRRLRKTKIDELPQLINVLKGDMSLVGPRPEVPRYVEMFHAAYEEILRVRPGITDSASITYAEESMLLAQAHDPEREYVERILPRKIELARQYVRSATLSGDFRLLLATLRRLTHAPARASQPDFSARR